MNHPPVKQPSGLYTLLNIAKSIAASRNRQDLWDIVDDSVLGAFGASYYTVCLLNEDNSTHIPFLYSQPERILSITGESPIIHESHPIQDGILDKILDAKEPAIFQLEDLIRRRIVPAYIYHWYNADVKEMMVIPVSNGAIVRGALYLYAKTSGTFHREQFSLLTGVADQLGTGISNVLANEKIALQLAEIRKFEQQLERDNSVRRTEQKMKAGFAQMVGASEEMQEVYSLISKVAPSDSTVLILGETGTGKELVARSIHEASARHHKQMVRINCAALPPTLMESELFGHEKGSFTGALERRIGKFELAADSTLFLDEIGEMPLDLQVKLLRALQEREIERVGGKHPIKVNVRIVAATNRDLEKEVQDGRFRSDLYYRLNVFPITLPALRNRKQDIPTLVSYFIERFGQHTGRKNPQISQKALESLLRYSWPGNVRELEHLIERTILLNPGSTIRQVAIPTTDNHSLARVTGEFSIRPLAEIEREYILKALKFCNGRVSGANGAAVRLGMPATTLNSKMAKLGIKKSHIASAS